MDYPQLSVEKKLFFFHSQSLLNSLKIYARQQASLMKSSMNRLLYCGGYECSGKAEL